jgi:hypothetical protein
VWLAVGCKTPNPLDCSDGNCTDPAAPYCDVDGSIGGGPMNTCIPIDCEPGEVVKCDGMDALVCNDSGNNLETNQCQFGCSEAEGCVQCFDDGDCGNPTPVCELASNQCRSCSTDAECASLVCRTDGTCVPPDDVAFASPAGIDTDTCTKETPCTLARALTAASANVGRSTVRLLPGAYPNAHTVTGGGAIAMVGDAQTVLAASFTVQNGASVTVRGVTFDGQAGTISCGSTVTNSALVFERVTVKNVGLTVGKCTAIIRDSRFEWRSGSGLVFMGGTLEVESSRFTGLTLPATYIALNPDSSTLKVLNSHFTNVKLATSSSTGSSTLVVAFSTLIETDPNDPGTIQCFPMGLTSVIENNIMFSDDAAIYGSCAQTARYNVLFPQVDPAHSSNLVQDPQLTNIAAGDITPRASSPAIDAAMPSASLSPTTDLQGTARPQGAKHDIGAIERIP